VGTSEGSEGERVEKDFGSVVWSFPGQCSFDARNRGSNKPRYL
jgi:hypothetical protein